MGLCGDVRREEEKKEGREGEWEQEREKDWEDDGSCWFVFGFCIFRERELEPSWAKVFSGSCFWFCFLFFVFCFAWGLWCLRPPGAEILFLRVFIGFVCCWQQSANRVPARGI